jgi:ABC-type Fe3+-hydroxamate transport system substrate-binding protein
MTVPCRSRRFFLQNALLAGGATVSWSSALATPIDYSGAPLPVATIDWTVLESLLWLGCIPCASADAVGYRQWVSHPVIPPRVADLGLRTEPNLEALAAARPERIFITPQFRRLKTLFEAICAVSEIDFRPGQADAWREAEDAIRDIAAWTGTDATAQARIVTARDDLERHAAHINDRIKAVLVAQFVDTRHVRVFNSNSLFAAVLARLKLNNAWRAEGARWGFDVIPLAQLAALEPIRFIHVAPLPEFVSQTLPDDPVWKSMPFVRTRQVYALPSCWPFGGVASGVRFAQLLQQRLAQPGTANV